MRGSCCPVPDGTRAQTMRPPSVPAAPPTISKSTSLNAVLDPGLKRELIDGECRPTHSSGLTLAPPGLAVGKLPIAAPQRSSLLGRALALRSLDLPGGERQRAGCSLDEAPGTRLAGSWSGSSRFRVRARNAGAGPELTARCSDSPFAVSRARKRSSRRVRAISGRAALS